MEGGAPHQGDDTRAWGPIELKGESAYSVREPEQEVARGRLKSDEGKALIKKLAAKADVCLRTSRRSSSWALGSTSSGSY